MNTTELETQLEQSTQLDEIEIVFQASLMYEFMLNNF